MMSSNPADPNGVPLSTNVGVDSSFPIDITNRDGVDAGLVDLNSQGIVVSAEVYVHFNPIISLFAQAWGWENGVFYDVTVL